MEVPWEVEAAAVFERDFCAGIASDVSSSYPAAARITGVATAAGEDEEGRDVELELGLCLGATGVAADDAPWGEYCSRRFPTGRDFPYTADSRGSPISSSSSSSASSSPSPGGGEGRAGIGVVRTDRGGVDSVAAPEVGSHCQGQVVGWPPVRAYRMNSLMNHSKENSDGNNSNSGNHKKATGCTDGVHYHNVKDNITRRGLQKKGLVGGSLFVKVNVDGMPIGRKVDLNAHCTYETLALALGDMFQELSSLNSPLRNANASKLLDGSSEFVLTYEDKDGDWMLVGDVPWRMFLSTAKRLRIMRTSGANGLWKRCQSSKGGG